MNPPYLSSHHQSLDKYMYGGRDIGGRCVFNDNLENEKNNLLNDFMVYVFSNYVIRTIHHPRMHSNRRISLLLHGTHHGSWLILYMSLYHVIKCLIYIANSQLCSSALYEENAFVFSFIRIKRWILGLTKDWLLIFP